MCATGRGGDTIKIGSTSVSVMETPCHTKVRSHRHVAPRWWDGMTVLTTVVRTGSLDVLRYGSQASFIRVVLCCVALCCA